MAMENGNFKTVLLVEDEGLTRSAMKSLILANEPLLDIDEADGFEQATEKLSARSYDLVFLDYQLRGNSTGLDLLNWIGEQEREVQTIMLSAQDDRDTVLECIRSGACGFISKASEQGAGVFREALKTILSGRVYLPNSVLGKGGHSPKPVSTHSGCDGGVAEPAAAPDGDAALFVAGFVEQGDREKNEYHREHRQGVFKRSPRPVSCDAADVPDRGNGAARD
jgi:DNA-binding NarL/FixJ family response regulator